LAPATLPATPPTRGFHLSRFAGLLLLASVTAGLLFSLWKEPDAPITPTTDLQLEAAAPILQPEGAKRPAPELDGGVEWFNTAGPLRMKDLKGKIVLLDFWTYCCINCIHILPDLEKLEKKYPNQLVVIGVHSAKFNAEKQSKNIREAILRYNIEHPVVNDANHAIWNAYHARGWPTFWLIDPEGNLFGTASGEGLYDTLDVNIAKLIEIHKGKKTLNEQPLRFDLDKFKMRKESPLFFPGKVLADAASGRVFIADSSHHRIVITDFNGKKIDVAGMGVSGKDDGTFDTAKFNDPQGMALSGHILYVADRKNHMLRALDLKARTVQTIAGVGTQNYQTTVNGNPRVTGLNSPWDLWLSGTKLFIAMAGRHQLWVLDLKENVLRTYAGDGAEDIVDGKLGNSQFAQPSGLAADDKWLYVADSEVSAIRAVSLPGGDTVKTLVGEGLFEFGDKDGVAKQVRLQHALGVAVYQGKLLVADTYNNKLKLLDPESLRCETYLGDGQPGKEDQPPRFDEPAGLCVAGDLLFVADTNNHAIRIVDLKTKAVRTLKLDGVTSPKPPVAEKPYIPEPVTTKLPAVAIPADGTVTLNITVDLAAGYKLNAEAPLEYLIEGVPTQGSAYEQIGKVDKPQKSFRIEIPAAKLQGMKTLKVSLAYYPCQEKGGLCLAKGQVWEMPLQAGDANSKREINLTTTKQ
jgi:thiol-disulfide isomerase/thioredoxin